MNKRILYVIIGAAAIALGIFCFFDRRLAGILGGIGLFLYGVGGFVHWNERKKAGAASAWALITAVIAVAFGLFILIGSRLGYIAGNFLLFSLSIWLMAEGVMEVLGAIMYRKAMTTEDLGVQAPGSVANMVLGVFMVAFGVLGVIFPLFAAFAVWVWIVLELVISGVRLIWHARSAGVLEESD